MPERLTEKQLLGMISFHESGIEHYERKLSPSMVAWSRKEVAKWRKQLEALNPPPSPSVLIRDGKMLATGDKE